MLISVDLIMTARMNVTKPTLRKSTLALHRMKSKDHEGFEEVRVFVKQVSSNSCSCVYYKPTCSQIQYADACFDL